MARGDRGAPRRERITPEQRTELFAKFAMNAVEPLFERAQKLGWRPIRPDSLIGGLTATLNGIAADNPAYVTLLETALEGSFMFAFPEMGTAARTFVHEALDILRDSYVQSLEETDKGAVEERYRAAQTGFRERMTGLMAAEEMEKKRQEARSYAKIESELTPAQRQELLAMEGWLARYWPDGTRRWEGYKAWISKEQVEYMLSLVPAAGDDDIYPVPDALQHVIPNRRRYLLIAKRLAFLESVKPHDKPELGDLKGHVIGTTIGLLRGETPPQIAAVRRQMEEATKASRLRRKNVEMRRRLMRRR